jgi:hypothetical protein
VVGKPKQSGNGTGTVYPRRNKEGKITGRRRYVSGKTRQKRSGLFVGRWRADRGLTGAP